jgi:hypothetical protein
MIPYQDRKKYPGVNWQLYEDQQMLKKKPNEEEEQKSGSKPLFKEKESGFKRLAKHLTHEQTLLGSDESPFGNVRDFAYGLGHGVSNVAKTIYSGAPSMPDIRQEHPSAISEKLGQYLPAMLLGGPSLAGQAVASGLYGMTQGEPGSRLQTGAKDAALTYLGGKAIQNIPGAARGIKSAYNYIHPEREAEKFRSQFGSGTSSENIENLGKRVEFGHKSAKEEALIPKNKLYEKEGLSNVYGTRPDQLPENNLEKMGHMIEPHGEFNENKMKALSSAIKDFRKFKPEYNKVNKKGEPVQTNKGDDIESFIDKVEDIFHVKELPEKQALKIQDALQMPVRRESRYFSDPHVTEFYGRYGLKTLHDKYAKNTSLENYDALQSAIKAEIRKLPDDTLGLEKKAALGSNVKNLNADKETFMKTLPEKMQNLENEFRTKYRENVINYHGDQSHPAIEKLSRGEWKEVTPHELEDAFIYQRPATLKVLKDIGPSGVKNIIYNALQKVKQNDAKGLATTILDLKRTKGYDDFITKEMENWAHNMLKHVERAGHINKGMATAGGALVGSALFGPIGGAVGAAAPWAGVAGKYLAEKLRK